jgi:hypothetical protein
MDHDEEVDDNTTMEATIDETEEDVDAETDPQEVNNAMDEKYGERSGVHNLRTRRP